MILDVYGIHNRYITPFSIYGQDYCFCNKAISAVWYIKTNEKEYLPMSCGDMYWLYKLINCNCLRFFLRLSLVAYARCKRRRLYMDECENLPKKYSKFIQKFCYRYMRLCIPFESQTAFILDQIRFGDFGVRLVTANGEYFIDQYQVFSRTMGRDTSYHISAYVKRYYRKLPTPKWKLIRNYDLRKKLTPDEYRWICIGLRYPTLLPDILVPIYHRPVYNS